MSRCYSGIIIFANIGSAYAESPQRILLCERFIPLNDYEHIICFRRTHLFFIYIYIDRDSSELQLLPAYPPLVFVLLPLFAAVVLWMVQGA